MEFFFIFIFGLIIGSFLNVLIDRLALEQKLTGRSYCDHCHHRLSWYDLIPIISYFLLKAKCRYCGKKISWQYPLVEFLTGFFFVLITHNQLLTNQKQRLFFPTREFFDPVENWLGFFSLSLISLIILLLIYSILIVIFFQDLKYQIISDWLQAFFFIFAFLYQIINIQSQFTHCNLFCFSRLLIDYFFAGIFVMLPILFLHLITRGRGMGFGDVKLSFTIGFFLGLKNGLIALYISFIFGGIVSIMLILLGRKRLKSKIAFGPFLVIGIILVWWFGEEILNRLSHFFWF